MRITVISLGAAPGEAAIAPVTALRRAGHLVTLLTRQPPTPEVGQAFDLIETMPPGRLPGGQVRRGKLTLTPDRLPAAWRLHQHPTVRGAQALVAADETALAAVWVAVRARRRRDVLALNGLPAAAARLG